MNLDSIPIWGLFLAAIVIVLASIETGYRLGLRAHRLSEDEKESPVSAIAGSVLGLLAFMLAFTFGMVADRYDTRRGLVREEANTIRTVYLRSDFLPEPDRAETKKLLQEYVADRLAVSKSFQTYKVNEEGVSKAMVETRRIQRRLWDITVVNARKDLDSDVAALYIDALNRMFELQSSRVGIVLQQRVPAGIWIVLCGLTIFGMAAVGYQTGIAGSKRSLAKPILAVSFSMVVALIASLDRPHNGYVKVSQQPLIDLYDSIASDGDALKTPTNQAPKEISQ